MGARGINTPTFYLLITCYCLPMAELNSKPEGGGMMQSSEVSLPGPIAGWRSVWRVDFEFLICYRPNWVSSKSYVEPLTPNVTLFEDRGFKEVKLNEVIKKGPWSDRTNVLIRRRINIIYLSSFTHPHLRTQPEDSCLSVRKRGLINTNSDGTLILDF